MNLIILMGRLTANPELSYTRNNNAQVTFTLAVDRPYNKTLKQERESRGEQVTDFISCVAYGTTAQLISQYVQKGHRLLVEGELNINASMQNGMKRYFTSVKVNTMKLIETRGGNYNNQQYTGSNNSSYSNNYQNSNHQMTNSYNRGFNNNSYSPTNQNSYSNMNNATFQADNSVKSNEDSFFNTDLDNLNSEDFEVIDDMDLDDVNLND